MKKTLSAAMALTLGMSLVAGVFAVETDVDKILFGSDKKVEEKEAMKPKYDTVALENRLAEIRRNQEQFKKDLVAREELLKNYCTIATKVDTLKSELERYEAAVKVAATLVKAHDEENLVVSADPNLSVDLPAMALLLPADKKELAADIKVLKDLATEVTAETKDKVLKSEHVEKATFNGKVLVKKDTTYAQALTAAVEAFKAKWEAVAEVGGKYQKALEEVVRLAGLDHAQLQHDYALNMALEAEYKKVVDEFKLDPQQYKGCPVRLVKHPADVKKEEAKKEEAKKDNVPNTASAAAGASVAFAAIFAAAAAVVAKRK